MIKKKFPSELRMDLVSNDWVIIATGRARRPESFSEDKKIKKINSKKDCPFCHEENIREKIARRDKKDGSWFAISIPNKFPALSPRQNGLADFCPFTLN